MWRGLAASGWLLRAATAQQAEQTWSHVKFETCRPGDDHQRWEIDSTTEATTIVSAADGRCLQAAECETSGDYARVVVDACDKEYTCGAKHAQWLPSSSAGHLGFQNLGSSRMTCLNNVGTWAVPDGKGFTWVCTWAFPGATACALTGDNSWVRPPPPPPPSPRPRHPSHHASPGS